MVDNDKLVKIVDRTTKLVLEGRFAEVRKAIEALSLSGELRTHSDAYCCEDCDGLGWWEQIAVVQDGQIWPTNNLDPEAIWVGPERTLRTRNTMAVKADYFPGSGWPEAQRFFRRQGRRAQRRLNKAILQEAMLDLE